MAKGKFKIMVYTFFMDNVTIVVKTAFNYHGKEKCQKNCCVSFVR
jgi:hypothetical protein